MTMHEVEQDILNDLKELEDPISQYLYLTECAKECDEFPAEYRNDEYLIKECQVSTWVFTKVSNCTCIFWADSQSIMVKGALALLQEIYAGRACNELKEYHCGLLEQEIFYRHFTLEQRKGMEVILSNLEKEIKYAIG